jgi:hypothetical protein
MWVEAIFAKEDLDKVMNDFCPLRVTLRQDGYVVISDPRDIELVPDVGLRMNVSVEVHWPILGVQIPVSARMVTLELKPEVLKKPGGDQLAFTFQLEGLNVSVFPDFVDRGIVDLVNAELAAKHVELAWGFTETMSHVFELPEALASAGAIDLRAAWGEVRITSKALVFAVSFHAEIQPRVAGAQPTASLVHQPGSSKDNTQPDLTRDASWSPSTKAALWVGGAALVAGLGVSAIAYSRRKPKTIFDYLRELDRL